ncbi:MAG: ABC transporter permease [Bacteroidia bacterium]
MSILRRTILIGLALFFTLPFIFLLVQSFAFQWKYPALLPEIFAGQFWANTFSGGNSLGNSLSLSVGLAVLTSAIATGLALPVSRAIALSAYRRVWLFLAYFPFVLAPVVYATTLKIYMVRLGLSSQVSGILLGHILIAFPFAVLVLESGWNQRMFSLMDQARTLGASSSDTYRKVVLPGFKALLALCLFQTFLISWYEYGLTALLGQSQVRTMPVQVYQFIQESNPALAALASSLLMLPPLILLLLNRKWLLRPQL